ncbi:hypothetical protein K8R43_03980 [archaeon]|nr:hypothetical protein [archaeon]
MEKYVKVHSPGIAGFPRAMVAAGEDLVLGVVHVFLTIVLLTAICMIAFNPILFQNIQLILVIGGIAVIDLWISHQMK